jgi:signal peptidase I
MREGATLCDAFQERKMDRTEANQQQARTGSRVNKSALHSASEPHGKGVLLHMREWLDALVIAFVLAMFIRTFVVELFKIPSGSMSPTLLGDLVAEGTAMDEVGQPHWYLLIKDRQSDNIQIFRKENAGHYTYEGRRWFNSLTVSQRDLVSLYLHPEEHRILVNKFAYWFRAPDRGDIVVFRVPFKKEESVYSRNDYDFFIKPYDRNMAVYVKRAVGLPNESIEINADDKRLYADGGLVVKPKIFQNLRYSIPETSEYKVDVPDGAALLFGDNSDNSSDSRYWGPVPLTLLRGEAFFRYWPLKKMRFLR